MLARRVEEVSSTIVRVKPSAGFGPMSCSELDDLLDEILSDQIFRSSVASSSHNPPPDSSTGATQQRNGQPTCNTAPQLSNNNNNNNNSNGGTRPRETAAAAKSWEDSRAGRDDSEHDTRYQVKNQANDVTGTQKTTGGNTEACSEVGRSSENGADNQTVAGSRGRAPSLPVSHSPAANRYRRLQSVPCTDYYGGAQSSTSAQSYYDRSDRFVRGMCSEEPVTWLDRQKLKLQSRNENRWWSNQSDQQKRLVEELKAAQTILRDGGGGEQTTWRADRGADDANGQNRTSHKSQSLGGGHQRPQHRPTAAGPSMPTMSDRQLEGLDGLLLQPCGGMLSDASARSDGVTSCKSEMNYYVSGVEIPPSTTHRTRYVFSVSSPPHSSSSASSSSFSRINSSDGVNHLLQQTVQLDQRVSARPGPPTPKRVSSRDALRQTLAARDWELEQWEQGSYTSLSSKSDVAETSVAADDRGNGTAPGRQPPASHLFSSSVGRCTDRSGPYDDAPSASRAHFLSTDGPARDHNGLPPGRGPGLERGPRLVVDGTSTTTTTTTSHGACTVDANGAGTTRSFDTLLLLNGSSSTSGTSSLSISSTSHQSAFEPVHQCPAADGHVTYGDLHGAAFSAVSGNPSSKPPEPETVSASMVVAVQTSSRPVTDMRPSLSDFALGLPDGFPARRSQHNPTGNAPVRTSPIRGRAPVYEKNQARIPSNASSLPSDVPFPGAAAMSGPSPKSQPAATVSLEKSSTSPRKKSEDVRGGQAMDSAGMIRKLPVSAEQEPPGSDGGMEVISLQLIGSGMQKLEPEGDLPAVRPVTPKCLQPGDANPLKSRPKSLGNPQRHNSSSEAASHSRPAVHQKFDPGPRRATIYDHTIAAAAAAAANSNTEQDIGSRTQLPEVLNGEDQTKQRLKHRRHTTSSGHVPGHSSSSEAPSTETAFRRTERLLSADFTAAQGGGGGGSGGLLDRRGSASPSAGGDRPTTGRRGSTLPAAAAAAAVAETRETSERTGRLLDGADDVFSSTKPPGGPERRNSKAHNKQRGEREREREVNLALLDSAVAGLRASASSPVDGSSSSSTVVQSPPPGKATPGVFPVRDPLSPRASIQPLSNGAVTTSSSNNSTDTTIRTNHAPRFVRDSSRFWHKPNISRDEAISSLKDKAPGSFVIRNSNSFPGAFGLALKVAHLPPNVQSRGGDPKAELVRHFLIEPTSKGVKLKGCSSEPVFGSLAALVYQHSMTPLSLPCKLIIPDPSSTRKRDDPTLTAVSDVATSEALLVGATCNVLYINSVDMESLTGNEAIDKAVAATFATTPTPLTTVVQLKVSSQGVTLTDVNRKQFFRRHYPVDTVTFAGIDPEMRSWIWTNEETKSAHKSNIFGFVARKQGSPMDNACHVFAELDRDQPGDAIVDFIMKVMLGQG